MQNPITKLQRDVKAPVFNLKDIYGRTIDLNTYQDKKLLIGFFRHAGCPFCNIRVHKLSKIYEDLHSKGLEMIFFFESPEKVLLQSTFHQEVSPIPLIADPEKQWYAAYGLEPSTFKASLSIISSFVQTAFKASSAGVPNQLPKEGESYTTMPAEFLISEGLIVKDVHYSERLNDRLDTQKIRNFVEESQSIPSLPK